MRIRIGACVLDTDRRQLTQADSVRSLSPKAFRLLEVLAERQPHAVSHMELRALVWPELHTGGTTLARLVNEIRAALGDETHPPRFVRAVPRFGYALTGAEPPDRPQTATALFSLQWENRRIPLQPGEYAIGRAADALVNVASPDVSRRHPVIVVHADRVILEDLGSKNGTYVGARKIDQPVELQDGDRIGIGPIMLIFRAGFEEDPTTCGSRG
jgi:DNA-binding winged helix-turn-helix (wHTH) protein